MEENNNVEVTPSVTNVEQPTIATPSAPVAVEPKPKKGGTGIIIFLLVLIVLGLCGFIYYKEFYKNTPEEPAAKEPEKTEPPKTEPEKTDKQITEEEALNIASEVYKKAYDALNGSVNTYEEETIDGDIYYRMDLELIEPYFSAKAMTKFKENFVEKDGKYYDIYNDGEGNKHSYLEDLIVYRTIFGGTDQGIRPLTIVSVSENAISATGQLTEKGEMETDPYPLNISFVYENGNWVIDSFE